MNYLSTYKIINFKIIIFFISGYEITFYIIFVNNSKKPLYYTLKKKK